MADTRVSYDASETELATIAQIKHHLSKAFGKGVVVHCVSVHSQHK